MMEIRSSAQAKPKDFGEHDEIVLGVLTMIDRNAQTSQRSISRELGVALGLANAYLKRCVNKGFIKIQHVPRRRYAYFLTPQGFAEKARLTGQYLSVSFMFFRRAREQMSDIIANCSERGWRRIVFAGVSELAEVGVLCASEYNIELVGIVDSTASNSRYLGLPIKATLEEFVEIDAVVITDLKAPEVVYRSNVAKLGVRRVVAPPLLRITAANAGSPNLPSDVNSE